MRLMKKTWQYIMIFVITAIAVVIYLYYHKVNLVQPICFDQDKAIDYFIKTVVTGNNDLQLGILSMCELNIQNIVMMLMIKSSGNVWVGINCYYILTFFMISFSMYHFLVKMKIPVPLSIGLAVLTAFLPFHVDRGEGQMITSNFFLAPLFLEMFYELMFCKEIDSYKRNYFLMVCLAAFIDVRFSTMLCILFGILLIQCRDRGLAKHASVYLIPLAVSTIVVASISSTLKAANMEMAGAEGMRILDLIEPLRYHVLGRFSNIRLDYDIAFSASGESGLNSMGLLFTVGFICMMFGLFFEWKKDKRIVWMGMISMFVMIIAGIAGIGLVLDYFGIHVTYWNRMAVLIIVCSVATVGIIMNNIADWVEKRFGQWALRANYVVMELIYIISFFELILRQNI